MIALVSEEGRDASGGVRSIVVGKLCKGKELRPVVLLIVGVDSEILLKRLVDSFRLPIAFRMITGGEVEPHI